MPRGWPCIWRVLHSDPRRLPVLDSQWHRNMHLVWESLQGGWRRGTAHVDAKQAVAELRQASKTCAPFQKTRVTRVKAPWRKRLPHQEEQATPTS